MDRYQYIDALQNHGFEKISGGVYSSVFGRPGWDYVIKVGNGSDDWADYIEWATKAGYAGTFAPKVYSLKYQPGGWYVAIMERLVATILETNWNNERFYDQNPFGPLYNAVHYWANPQRGAESTLDHPDLKKFAEMVSEAGFNNDMHRGNMMVRKDGQIVLIDPSSRSSYRRKLRIKRGNIHTPSGEINDIHG